MMKWLTVFFAAGLGWTFGIVRPAAAGIVLADQGKSDFTIVVPEKAPASVKAAAEELAKDIALASGAKLPIATDGSKISGAVISLGETKQARSAEIEDKDVPQEGFRIATKDGNLYILGPDTPDGQWTTNGGVSNGTANGVYSFLENQLGVRWLMPGDLGRDVPALGKVEIEDLDRVHSPRFSYRNITYLTEGSVGSAAQEWEDRQRLGSTWNLNVGHNWTWLTRDPAYYKAHPEWFAMNAQGKRPPPPPGREKLETTNPELVKFFAEAAIKKLKQNKRPQTYSLSPSDGRGWSESPQSKALYDPSPSNLFDPEAPAGFPSMSSLVLKWYHDVSQIVAREYPQGRLAGYIYADYVYPPKKVSMKLPDNFIPMICGIGEYGYGLYRKDNQERYNHVMDSWAKVAPTDWFYYGLPNQLLRQDNDEIGGGNFPGSTGIVTPAAPDIINFVFDNMVRNHMKGAVLYGVPSWSNAAMANYILAQMMWNPKQDAHAIQRDWLNRAYGEQAGATMLQFYEKLNGWFRDYYEANAGLSYKLTDAMLKDLYAAHYGEMESLFLQTQGRAMTGVQKQRLQLIGDNLIVLQSRLRSGGFWPEGLTSTLQRDDQKVAALLEQSTDGFELFPGIDRGTFGRGQRALLRKATADLKELKLAAVEGKAPKAEGNLPKFDATTFMIYARRDMEIRIVPKRISSGVYFATYLVARDYSQIMSGSREEVAASGVLSVGKPITFSAKANTPYYLYIPPRKTVQYELTIENATVAKGAVDNGTLTLYGDAQPVYVFYPSRHATIGAFDDGGSVTINSFPGASFISSMMRSGYTDVQVVHNLDDGWRFHPDPQNDGLSRGITQAGFDDHDWKTVSALTWWQKQGFGDYHGPAWYRIHFTAPALKPGEAAMVYFGAVDGDAVIYVNGRKIGEHRLGEDYYGWNKPFARNATAAIRPGDNVLAVQVTSKPRGSSGIIRGVSLLTGSAKQK